MDDEMESFTDKSEQIGQTPLSAHSSTCRSSAHVSENNVTSISDYRKYGKDATPSTGSIEQASCDKASSTSRIVNEGCPNEPSSSDSQLSDEGSKNSDQTDCARTRHFRKNHRGLDDDLPVLSPAEIAEAIQQRRRQQKKVASKPKENRQRCYNPCEPSDPREVCPKCAQRYGMAPLNVTLKISDAEVSALTREIDREKMEQLLKFSKMLREIEKEVDKLKRQADELNKNRVKRITVGLFRVRDPVTESATDQAMDQATNLASDLAMDQATDQVMDVASDQAMDFATDPNPEANRNAVLNVSPDADANMDLDADPEMDQ